MAIVNGTDLVLEISTDGGTNYYATAFASSCSLSINMDTRDATNKSSSGWADKLEAGRSWSVDADGLQDFQPSGAATITEFDELFAQMNTRSVVKIKFKTSTTGDYYYSGDAYITSLSMDAPTEDNVTYSVSLEGTGALTEATL